MLVLSNPLYCKFVLHSRKRQAVHRLGNASMCISEVGHI